MTTRRRAREPGTRRETADSTGSTARPADRADATSGRSAGRPAGESAGDHPVAGLQDRHGNRAVQRLVASGRIRTASAETGSGDRFERETARVAESVVDGVAVVDASAGADSGERLAGAGESISHVEGLRVQRRARRGPRPAARRPSAAELRSRNRMKERALNSMRRSRQRVSRRDRERSEREQLREQRIRRENFEGWLAARLQHTGTDGTRGPPSTPMQAVASALGQLEKAMAFLTVDANDPWGRHLASFGAAEEFLKVVAASTEVSRSVQWYGVVDRFADPPVLEMVATEPDVLAAAAAGDASLAVRPMDELSKRFALAVDFERKKEQMLRQRDPRGRPW